MIRVKWMIIASQLRPRSISFDGVWTQKSKKPLIFWNHTHIFVLGISWVVIKLLLWIPYTVHTSFVVIKTDSSWHYGDYGVDFVVKGPNGEQVHDELDYFILVLWFVFASVKSPETLWRNFKPYLKAKYRYCLWLLSIAVDHRQHHFDMIRP